MQKFLFYLSFITVLLMATPLEAQTKKTIQGAYILQKIEDNDRVQTQGQLVNFSDDGLFYVQDIPFGKWSYSSKNNKLNLTHKKVAGDYSVSFDSGVLQLQLESKTLFFLKIDKEKILKDNKASSLIGTWEAKDTIAENPTHKILVINEPDQLKLIVKEEGVTGSYSGVWLFFPKKQQLFIVGQVDGFRGENKLISYNDSLFILESNGVQTTFNRVMKTLKKEKLDFSEDDFYDENGNYKYEKDTAKLPWQDSYSYIDNMTSIHQLKYQYSQFIKESQTFETKTIVADVSVDEDNDSFKIDYIFDGYDRYHLPQGATLPVKDYEPSNPLFPFGDEVFRVLGKETIQVPAGTFSCTEVETIGNFDDKIKLWMIDNKPGVMAKVIIESEGTFGKYEEYKLQKINIAGK